jgi:hypothetical protein
VTRHPPPRRIPLPSGPTAFPKRAASSSLSIVLARANCGPAAPWPEMEEVEATMRLPAHAAVAFRGSSSR